MTANKLRSHTTDLIITMPDYEGAGKYVVQACHKAVTPEIECQPDRIHLDDIIIWMPYTMTLFLKSTDGAGCFRIVEEVQNTFDRIKKQIAIVQFKLYTF